MNLSVRTHRNFNRLQSIGDTPTSVDNGTELPYIASIYLLKRSATFHLHRIEAHTSYPFGVGRWTLVATDDDALLNCFTRSHARLINKRKIGVNGVISLLVLPAASILCISAPHADSASTANSGSNAVSLRWPYFEHFGVECELLLLNGCCFRLLWLLGTELHSNSIKERSMEKFN